MEIREKIKSAGLKATPQRRKVYEVMQELRHAPIDDVIVHVQSVIPDVTVSTIYRIMDSFCTVGLLSKMNHPSGIKLFDITPGEHHHIFNASGTIMDFEDRALTDLIKTNLQSVIGRDEAIEKISIQITTTTKTKQS